MSKTVSARIDDTLHTMITDEANQDGKTVKKLTIPSASINITVQ